MSTRSAAEGAKSYDVIEAATPKTEGRVNKMDGYMDGFTQVA
jgi:hypothetical protein